MAADRIPHFSSGLDVAISQNVYGSSLRFEVTKVTHDEIESRINSGNV
jgi:hypothetical protein